MTVDLSWCEGIPDRDDLDAIATGPRAAFEDVLTATSMQPRCPSPPSHGPEETAVPAHRAIERHLLEAVGELAGNPSELTAETELAAIDIDSLDLADFADLTREQFGVELSGNEVVGATTFGDFLALVGARASAALPPGSDGG